MKKHIRLQEDEKDCGACSLYTIIRYFNGFIPLDIIKLDTFTNSDGTTFYNLKEAAKKYNLDAYGVNKPMPDKFPCIVQVKYKTGLYHFIVVYKIFKDTLYIMDPSKGDIKLSISEFKDIFTGNILEFIPSKRVVIYNKSNEFKSIIKDIIYSNKYSIILILLLSIMYVIISLISTYYIKIIINLKYYIFLFIVLSLIKVLISIVKEYLTIYLNRIVNTKLIYNYLNKLLNLPFKYLHLKKEGELITRINDLDSVKDFITKEIVNIIIYTLYMIFTLIIMFYLDITLTIYLGLLSIIYGIIIYLYNKHKERVYLDYLDNSSNLSNLISNVISNINTIRSLNKGSYFLNMLDNTIYNTYTSNLKVEKSLSIVKTIILSFYELSIILIVLLSNNITNLCMYLLYFNYYYESCIYFYNMISIYTYLKMLILRINGVYYLDNENICGIDYVYGDICIKDVSIRVSNRYIFKDINLCIKKYDKLLIKGINGSGKTSLFNIIYKYIDEYDGSVFIDKYNLKDISIDSLRSNIRYVNQEEKLFNMSIISNIVLDKKYDEDKFKLICNMLYLNNIDYMKVFDHNLSGGEEQRIVLARTLYQGFDILLLDEALSKVSCNLKEKIVNNLNTYYDDKTIIYISHNLKNRLFKHIYYLDARKEIYAKR